MCVATRCIVYFTNENGEDDKVGRSSGACRTQLSGAGHEFEEGGSEGSKRVSERPIV